MVNESFDRSAFFAETQKLFTNELFNKALMDNLPYPAMLIRKDRRVLSANKAAREIEVEVASFCWDTFGKKASISKEDRRS